MPTEVFEIVIRERGTTASARGITRVQRSARSAAAAVGLLVTAVAGLAGAAGLGAIARDAISASVAFEQYGVRLGALLGSQSEANKALETFVGLSTRTPFAVSQIVEGAATLAGAALGNRERLEELTQTAANLSAVTGLSFQEAAGNLQRSLQAGIGAADLFRERGVRAIIEAIGGIPDATQLTTDELEALFQEAFGEGGVFGNAAEQLSLTLGGALSNIGDAATNARVALGDAFSGPVISAARGVLIPTLQELQGIIEGNEDAFAALARDGITLAIQGFGSFAFVAVETIRVLNQLRGVTSLISGTFAQFQLGEAEDQLERLNSQLQVAQAGGREDLAEALIGRIDEKTAEIARLRAQVDGLAQDNGQARREAEELDQALERISLQAQRLSVGGFQIDTERPEVQGGAELPNIERAAQESQARIDARAEILRLTEAATLADAKRIEPLDAALLRLERQRDALLEAAEASGDATQAQEGLDAINRQIAAVEAQKTAETERQAQLQAEIALLIQQAAQVSPELAAEIQKAADAAVEAGGGLEDVNRGLEQARDAAKKGLDEAQDEVNRFGDQTGRILSSSIGSAVRGAISGEGVDAVQLLADTAGRLMEQALNSALEGGFGNLGGIFGGGGAGGAGGGGGGGGFNLGGALTATLGAATTVLAGALRDTTTSISTDLVRSAVSQSEAAATRGIIAGPTNVPIFQVGQQLEAAFGPTNDILEAISATLVAILAATGGGGGGGVGTDFDSTTPSLS